jgi:CRISPR-associated protein Cas5d
MKVERVSYEVMTPSAARGVLEAVLFKPQMAWEIEAITVLAPIRWTSFRRNEVNSRASTKSRDHYLADEDRAQRNTLALRDVDYVIDARVRLTEQAGPGDNLAKYEEMFERRLAKGQHFHAPYLGCREFDAALSPVTEEPAPCRDATVSVDRPLGLVFYDFAWTVGAPGGAAKSAKETTKARPLFFDARLTGGVLRVPSFAEVLRQNGVAS